MVELPEGKMKSREGTVVDADDLINEVIETARQTTLELGKLENFETEEAEKLFRQIGLGGLKYFILKVDPMKNMMFNPAESIDFNGNTGPFIQYTHARIQSLLRKSGINDIDSLSFPTDCGHARTRAGVADTLPRLHTCAAAGGCRAEPCTYCQLCV